MTLLLPAAYKIFQPRRKWTSIALLSVIYLFFSRNENREVRLTKHLPATSQLDQTLCFVNRNSLPTGENVGACV